MKYNGENWAFSKNFINDISGIIKNNPNTYKKIERIFPLIISWDFPHKVLKWHKDFYRVVVGWDYRIVYQKINWIFYFFICCKKRSEVYRNLKRDIEKSNK